MQSRQLIKELEAAGWALVRVTGSHHVFKHP
ncbi:type II toxin-antitoxin system HicA family toxin [Enterobacterales bacterium AW_CKDN230030176-1A_HGKHYDSX7]